MPRRKKPRRGRPPRADKAATERIEIRVTKLERAAWEHAAAQAGISVSEWIRRSGRAEQDRLRAQCDAARAAVLYLWKSWAEAEGDEQPRSWVFGPDAEMRAYLTEQGESFAEAPADVQAVIRDVLQESGR